jgi:hypothetical protein
VRPGDAVEESASPQGCRPQQGARPDVTPVLVVIVVVEIVSGTHLPVVLDQHELADDVRA